VDIESGSEDAVTRKFGAGMLAQRPAPGADRPRPANRVNALQRGTRARDLPQFDEAGEQSACPAGLTAVRSALAFWTVSRLHLFALDRFRRRQRTLTRAVLALFCLVWLQAALVPCAMALAPDGMAGAQAEHCAYCPPADASGGGPAADTGCTYPDGPQVDSRAALAAPLLIAMPPVSYVLDVSTMAPAPLADEHRLPDRAGPPLAVTYCRFLK
jgi:hypothetical protein